MLHSSSIYAVTTEEYTLITSSNHQQRAHRRHSCTYAFTQNWETLYTIKMSKVFHSTGPMKWLLPNKTEWGIHPQRCINHCIWKIWVPTIPFGLFLYLSIYDLFALDKVTTQGQGCRYMAHLDDIMIYGRIEKEQLENMDCALQMFTQSQTQKSSWVNVHSLKSEYPI